MPEAGFSYTLFIIFALTFIVTAAGTWLLIKIFKKQKVFLDKPNKRSNHKIAVPRGGGIAVIPVIIAGILYLSHFIYKDLHIIWPFLISVTVLLIVSFIDDIRGGISPLTRLIVQIIAVGIGIKLLINIAPVDGVILFGFLPFWLDILITYVIWLWFVNLYNFMDGIDGITCTESVFINIGICLSVVLGNTGLALYGYAAIVIAASLGFLIWNWQPAKIFIGDVGSIPLGFIIGWLLIGLAMQGYYIAALIFPCYYLSDSTITIIKRLLKGKKIWEPHSEHFYQQAVRKGMRHSSVVKIIMINNILLLLLGSMSVLYKNYEVLFLATAYGITFFTLIFFRKKNIA